MSTIFSVLNRSCMLGKSCHSSFRDLTEVLVRSSTSILAGKDFRTDNVIAHQHSHYISQYGAHVIDLSCLNEYGRRRSKDLKGFPTFISTRSFSSINHSFHRNRSSITRLSSTVSNGSSKNLENIAVNGEKNIVEVIGEPKEKLAFDPRSKYADEFYEKLSKVLPSPEKQIEAGPLTVWQRFKDLYKKYWYVVIPVHSVLCVGWYGIFYLLALRGFDVLPVLQKIGVSETLLSPLRKSGAGYLASAFAMYKVASPLRYSVTLGVTTVAINYLKKHGYIRPMPSTAQMRQFVNEKRLEILSKRKIRKSKKRKDTIRRRLALLFRRPLSGFAGKSNGKIKANES